jgi:hypothetical protein
MKKVFVLYSEFLRENYGRTVQGVLDDEEAAKKWVNDNNSTVGLVNSYEYSYEEFKLNNI